MRCALLEKSRGDLDRNLPRYINELNHPIISSLSSVVSDVWIISWLCLFGVNFRPNVQLKAGASRTMHGQLESNACKDGTVEICFFKTSKVNVFQMNNIRRN